MHLEAEVAVLIAFVILVAIMGYLGVHKAILRFIDARAAIVQGELSEAKRLREEAQSLLAEYESKRGASVAEANRLVQDARAEAERIAAEAQEKLTQFVARRTQQAEQKIAQAEREATAEVRAAAIDRAIKASERLLAGEAGAAAGEKLMQSGINDVRTRLS